MDSEIAQQGNQLGEVNTDKPPTVVVTQPSDY
jgi:hypothetical protein